MFIIKQNVMQWILLALGIIDLQILHNNVRLLQGFTTLFQNFLDCQFQFSIGGHKNFMYQLEKLQSSINILPCTIVVYVTYEQWLVLF